MSQRLRRLIGGPWIYLLFAALWLLPLLMHPNEIAYWRGAQHSDMMVSHWPNAHYFKRSLNTWGQIPLWNSQILSGAPFLADPLSGVWYLPNWLTLVLPIHLAFNLLLWLHLAWAGWGMYRLMQSEGFGSVASLTSALLFSGTPKFIAHLGLGHISLVFAVSWTPWVLFVARRVYESCVHGPSSNLRWAALAGGLIGLVFLTDPRWALPLGLLLIVYWIRLIAHSRLGHGLETDVLPFGRLLRAALVGLFFTSMIASGLGLSLAEFVRESTRTGMGISGQTELSLPPLHLIGILVPFLSQPEWLAYSGVTALVLALIALITTRENTWFWFGLVIIAWMISLGEHTPLYNLLNAFVPGAKLLRVPPRFLFISAFGLAALAGAGMDALLKIELSQTHMRRVRLGATGLLFSIIALAVWFGLFVEDTPLVIPGIAIIALLGFVCLVIALSTRWTREAKATAWIVLLSIDLIWVNAQLLDLKPLNAVIAEKEKLVRELAIEPSGERIFSPSYSIPQQTAAQYGLQLADGVNPLQIRKYREYMARATGFSSEPYSVTLPPFSSGETNTPWPVHIDALMLGRMNVNYIVAEYPISSPAMVFDGRVEGSYIYRNEIGMPRVWVESLETVGMWWDAESIKWTPNTITIQAKGPGKLVLSEIDFPGWVVSVDGSSSEIEPSYEVLRSVQIPEGIHNVSFNYRPRTMYFGVGLMLIATVSLIIIWLRR